MSNTYADIATFVPTSEFIGEVVETDDYVDYNLLAIGNYISNERTAKVNEKPDGNIVYELGFKDGLTNEEHGTVGVGERTYLSTKPFEQKGRPGKTSTVGRYLAACGLSAAGCTPAETVSLVAQSLEIPVEVRIDWTNQTEKLADGSYSKETLKTKDFNFGTPEAPVYRPSVTIEGKEFKAKHRINGFRKV
jgi:hypothetical protein